MKLIPMFGTLLMGFLASCGGGGSSASSPPPPPVTIAWGAPTYVVATNNSLTVQGNVTVTGGSLPLPPIVSISIVPNPATTDGLVMSFPNGTYDSSHTGNTVTFPVVWTVSLIHIGTTATYPYGTTSATATYLLGSTGGTTTAYTATTSIVVQ